MKHLFVIALGFLLACNAAPQARPEYAIAIHGGAGTILPENITPEKESAYRAALDTALRTGEKILAEGGTALDAVTAAVSWMEDSPLFNAGRGAVFTHDGINELDASIMDGSNLRAGAVCGVQTVRHPVQLARKVMENSPHVMLAGKGAETFAAEQGLEIVEPAWFFTQSRWEALQKIRQTEPDTIPPKNTPHKYGTVGCVALDQYGNLAAATSTGGMTNKRWNRIGDSPVIGAGTYANNQGCAVSCTGHGEYFIRYNVAHDVCARMLYGKQSLLDAANQVVYQTLAETGGDGGLIAVDRNGNIAMPFNTPGMYRGFALPTERAIHIFKQSSHE